MKGFRGALIPALVSFALWLALTIGLAPRGGGDPTLQITSSIGWQFMLGCAVAIAAHRAILHSDLGFDLGSKGTGWIVIFPLILCAVFGVVAAQAGLPGGRVVGLILINAALIAVSEEVMFRGLILGAMRRQMSVAMAMILSSILFGVSHVANSLLTDDLKPAILQALSAMMLGQFLAILRLKTGTLWPGILFHTLWNAGLVLMLQADAELPLWTFALPFVAVVLLTIYAAILWRWGKAIGP